MKLRTALTVAFLGLATLACGGGGDGADWSTDYSVDMTSPWTDLGLPVDDGSVVLSNDSTIAINYEDAAPKEVADRFLAHLKSDGWEETYSDMTGDMPTAILKKDSKQLTLSAMEALGRTTLSMTLSEV